MILVKINFSLGRNSFRFDLTHKMQFFIMLPVLHNRHVVFVPDPSTAGSPCLCAMYADPKAIDSKEAVRGSMLTILVLMFSMV